MISAPNILLGLGWACFVASVVVVIHVFIVGHRTDDSDFWFRVLAWFGFNFYVLAAVLAVGGI